MSPDITIASPSWKRADRAITHRYLPTVYVVAESQAEAYRARDLPVWVCPDSAQGSTSRVRNWILDNTPTKQLLMVDDDLRDLGQWNGTARRRMTGPEALEFIGHGFALASEMGVRLWGLNPAAADKQAYRESNPFSLAAFVGGPFTGFIDCPLRYDERIPLKEDYDMTLQVLNRYRRLLRFNMVHYFNDMHGLPGGCADMRNLEREKEQFALLVKKWGTDIVRIDKGASHNKRRVREASYDLNPKLRIPIGGV
ncbi:hypothetical protein [Roseibacillus ishigakijimensis]|uniref:TET-Associated Glycosyltransferase domain-containing protein n=1 Tax=Roseibacillus ishigakijimensis TaxID=454146 RepID=A0A934VNG7_9BACT|nr:hypothetical protein [Roseibacillus ishigakijimensis]MBK1835025.1 hypothetical protein [Roseibacillus ishigakijimensis]